MLSVVSFPGSTLANTYLVIEDDKAIVFDMGIKWETLRNYLEKHNLTLLGIYITHGHYDHIIGLEGYDGDAPIYCGNSDIKMFASPKLNLGCDMFGHPLSLDLEVNALIDGEEFLFAFHPVAVIATPFHTLGSLCFYFVEDGLCFTGDTLFRLGIGRSDLPHACPRFTEDSLHKLKALPPETKIFPGHGPTSTLEFEFAHNPYLSN